MRFIKDYSWLKVTFGTMWTMTATKITKGELAGWIETRIEDKTEDDEQDNSADPHNKKRR